jgi:hypothetical protein
MKSPDVVWERQSLEWPVGFQDGDGRQARLPTEFNRYEGALARTFGLPTLVLVQQDVMRRVVFDPHLGGDIYALLPDKVDIGPIERVVSGFTATL